MLIRLPKAEKYAAQVEKEHVWLPKLAPHISYKIPKPLALGRPSKDYPFFWSIYEWIEGESANTLDIEEKHLSTIALKLAQFLQELHFIDTTNGPLSGIHNFYRGGNLSIYDIETRNAIKSLHDVIDVNAAISIWETALQTTWNKKTVWVHGDISSGNILIKENNLYAIIDFGLMAIGDPACDLVIAWTFFKKENRNIFMSHLALDTDTWARARGWCLWKTLIALSSLKNRTSKEALNLQQIISNVLRKI